MGIIKGKRKILKGTRHREEKKKRRTEKREETNTCQ